MKKIGLSETEWKLMDELWEEPPKTITQLTRALEEDTGWGKNVIITMLKRLEAKGAVRHEEGERAKQFYPAVSREDTALEETRGFLNRVYSGRRHGEQPVALGPGDRGTERDSEKGGGGTEWLKL